MDLPEEAKRAPSAPVWNQSFPSPSTSTSKSAVTQTWSISGLNTVQYCPSCFQSFSRCCAVLHHLQQVKGYSVQLADYWRSVAHHWHLALSIVCCFCIVICHWVTVTVNWANWLIICSVWNWNHIFSNTELLTLNQHSKIILCFNGKVS